MSTRQPVRLRGPAAAALTVAVALLGVVVAVLTSSPDARAATGCQVGYRVDQWTGGFVGYVTVSPGDTAVSSWKVTWTYTGGQLITSAWNATVVQSGAGITATSMSYNGSVPAGGSVQFGVQGTFTGSNPAPADFALNGVPCNGAAASPSPSSGSASPSASPSASVSPSPSASASPTGSPSPTGSSGAGCGSAAICDGFENQAAGTPSGAWTTNFPSCSGTGSATIDTAMAHAGSKSLRIDGTAGYCNHVFVKSSTSLTTIGSVWYARFYIRHTTALPAAHVTFVAMADANDANNDLRMGGQNGALQWNRQSDDATLPAQSPVGVALSTPLPTGTWSCLEFKVDGTDGTMDTWLNGTEVAGLNEDGTPTQDVDSQWLSRANWRPALTDFRIGWESYGDGADTLWFDDVAVGSSRIGC